MVWIRRWTVAMDKASLGGFGGSKYELATSQTVPGVGVGDDAVGHFLMGLCCMGCAANHMPST